MRRLLFTDLDGSLLDHHDYDYSAALPAIKQLQQRNIPWVLTTSKTASEVVELRDELDNAFPFIVENGAGIFWPKGSMNHRYLLISDGVQSWGEEYEYMSLHSVALGEILTLAKAAKQELGLKFTGFSEMSVPQVVECTGLSFDKAAKAKQRHFSEPLLWQDSEENLLKLKAYMKPFGLELIKGGRFVHLMGTSNKGFALKVLACYYRHAWQEPVLTMALGDGQNDVPLLEASDAPVIIRSPVNEAPQVSHPQVEITESFGPEGWNQAVLDWLD